MRKEQVLVPAIRKIMEYPRLADTLFRWESWGNPFNEEVLANPFPFYDLYRDVGPVVYKSIYQQWFVMGHDEAIETLHSSVGSVGGQIDMFMSIRPYTQLSEQSRSFFRNLFIMLDPPDHTRLRGLVARTFTPRRIAELEPRIEALSKELLQDIADQSQPEMVNSYNRKLPLYVVAEMLGLPRERWEWLRSATDVVVQLLDPFKTFDPEQMDATIADLHSYFIELLHERQQNPTDDLISALAQAEDDGDQLTENEFVRTVLLLLGAGTETTTGALGTGTLALADNPDQRQLLRDKSELWPNAVEELLRYDPPIKALGRQVVDDFEVGGQTIPAGSNVVILLNVANRDLRRMPDADDLRVDRQDPSPLSFGHGIHYCIGAALAKTELKVGLRHIIETFGDYTVDREAVEWRVSTSMRNPTKLVLSSGRS